MSTPTIPGHTEAEIVAIIEKIAYRFGKKFSFPGWPPEDIVAEGRLIAWKALQTYEPTKGPLEHYLSRSVRNRILNKKRDAYRRAEPACRICAQAEDRGQPSPHGNCQPHERWKANNSRKMALAQSYEQKEDFRSVQDEGIENVDTADLLDYIGHKLTDEQRVVWLQMRDGQTGIRREQRRAVEAAVVRILADAGLDVSLPDA